MSIISGLDQIVALARRRLAENAKRTSRRGAGASNRPSSASRANRQDVYRNVGERLRVLDPLHWDEHKARRIFIETVLTAEFGEELESDPAFADVIADVGRAMESDAGLNEKLQVLLKQMRDAV